MAGGPNAASMMCLECGGKADRVLEGSENDQYNCTQCGKGFSVDWRRGPPSKPTWPDNPDGLSEAQRLFALIKAQKAQRDPKT
jgi:hypothetical protein